MLTMFQKVQPETRGKKSAKSSNLFVETILHSSSENPDEWILGSGFSAVRAASCLVEPEEQDEVIIAVTEGQNFILSILRREVPVPLSLSPTSDNGINLKTRFFNITSESTINLHALRGIDLEAPLGTIRTLSENFFQSVLGSIVSVGKAMVQNTDTYQLSVKESAISKAGIQVINADRDLFMDADRINMG